MRGTEKGRARAVVDAGSVLFLFRLLVCEELKKDAPGVDYSAGAIVLHLKVRDPWRTDPDRELPAVVLSLVQLKEQGSGAIVEAWNVKKAA